MTKLPTFTWKVEFFDVLRHLEEYYSGRLLINIGLEWNHFAMVTLVCAFTLHVIKSLYYSCLAWMTASAPSGMAVSLLRRNTWTLRAGCCFFVLGWVTGLHCLQTSWRRCIIKFCLFLSPGLSLTYCHAVRSFPLHWDSVKPSKV